MAQALASATAKERRRLRLQQRRVNAEMLAAGMTQAATAGALGVTDRTIRNWAKGKAFQRALARAQARAERQSSADYGCGDVLFLVHARGPC